MAVDTSAVQIVINVTDGNSGEVISRIERSFSNMGAAGATSGKKMAAAMNEVGNAARAADAAAANAGSHMGGHFQTSFDRVRLLRTELGVQVPRAMESVIARNEALMASINALGGVLVGIGFAGIFVSLGKEAYNLYERWLDVGAAVDKYNKKAAEAAAQKFGESSSIEDLNADLVKANTLLDQLNQKKQASGVDQFGGSFFQYIPKWIRDAGDPRGLTQMRDFGKPYAPFTMGDADRLNANQGKLDQDTQRKIDEDHKVALAKIQNSKTVTDAHLQGNGKIDAAERAADKEAEENHRFKIAQEKELAAIADRGLKPTDPNYVTVRPDAGNTEENLQKQKAAAEADAQRFALQREQTHELMQLRNEATNAQLRGIALYKAQEEQAIEELKFKDMDSTAARDAIHAKFHAEEMRRLQDEQAAVAKRAREADTAGMTGMQKLQAEGRLHDQDILADVSAGKYESLADAQQDRVTNQRKTLAEMQAAEHSFTDEVDRLADQSTTHQISGFARIRADQSKQLDELKKKFDQTYGGMDMTAPGAAGIYQHGQSDLERGQSAIRSGAAQQEQDLARKNAQETAQIEAEARGKFLSAEKQKTAAIESEYEQRLQKYKDQLAQQEISYDDFNRRIAAAAQQRDAEMVAEAQAARQKMAGEFDSLFKSMDHPLKALQSMGEKAAANAAATLITHTQMRGQPGAPQQKTGWAGVFDTFGLGSVIPGSDALHRHGGVFAPAQTATPEIPVPAATGAGRHAPPQAIAELATPHARNVAEGHTLSFASAQIHVDSANVTLGSGSGSGPGGSSSGTSSTTGAYLGSAGIPSAGGGITGVASDARSGIGFTQSAVRTFGGGTGGAASGGTPGAPASTGAGVAAPGGSSANVLGDLQKGVGLTQSLTKDLGSSSPSSRAAALEPTDPQLTELIGGGTSSSTTAAARNGGMLGGGGLAANAGGAAGGVLGLYGAYESSGGVGGALSGASSGAELGMVVGGPVGAAVGAIGGAIMGVFGPGGAEKARVYDLKQVRPRITADQDAYSQGGMDYLAAYSDLQSADMAAKKATDAMGFAGSHYYQDNIKPELQKAEARFTAEQRAGRSNYTATAASYDVGSDYVPRDGMAMIHEGERIMPSDQNERITSAIEGGSMMPAASGPPGDVNLNFYAHDSKSAMQFLMANKHVIRSAINESYAENSGGSDA